jgi:hypothetical protein
MATRPEFEQLRRSRLCRKAGEATRVRCGLAREDGRRRCVGSTRREPELLSRRQNDHARQPPYSECAAERLLGASHPILHEAREEPSGQTVARLLSNEGSVIGISYAPSQHAE